MGLAGHVDELLGGATERGEVPGIVAVAARGDGSRLYEGAFGRRALGGGTPMTLAPSSGWRR